MKGNDIRCGRCVNWTEAEPQIRINQLLQGECDILNKRTNEYCPCLKQGIFKLLAVSDAK